MKRLEQRRFLKGVIAGTSDFTQPPNSVPRISNLLLTRRGSLVTCDGSKIISAYNGAVQVGWGTWTAILLLKPTGISNLYIGIQKDLNTHLGAPTGLAQALVAGGVLTGAYTYVVTALDAAGGETVASGSVVANPVAQKVQLTWNSVTLAVSYNVYRTTAGGGTELLLANVPFVSTATTTYLDNLPDGSLGTQQPPLTDTTQVCQWYSIPATSYGAANILKTLPSDPVGNLDTTPGGHGGSQGGGGSGTGGGKGFSPSGGIPNALSAIPLLLQFLDFAILCPGNGYAPQVYNPAIPVSGGNPTAIVNTFSPIYPNWVANTVYVAGDVVVPNPSNGHFYTCIQGGTSGGVQPTFATGTKSKTADGVIIWQEAGSTNPTSPPRGAAHGVVHLGCLWVGNTFPSNTSDNLDGPSVIRQSDVNNPNSWNPVNVAFLGKDDGTQITGMTPFTIGEFGIAPTPSLVVFKDFSTYQIIGLFGASNFSIQLAQTDLGCIAPRSIQFIPGFGIARLTHLGVAIFDGVKDRLITEDIRPYIFSDPGSVSDIVGIDQSFAYFSKGTQVADPPMYVLAIPQLSGGSLFTLPASSFTHPTSADTWPVGNMYFIVQAWTSSVIYQAPEQVINIAAGQTIFLQNAFEPYGTTRIRVYYGPTPGGENKYQDFFPQPVFFGGHIVGYVFNYPLHLLYANSLVGSPASGFGALTRILCFDLIAKAWTIVDLPWAIGVLTQVRAQGTVPITVIGTFTDGTMRRWQANDADWDGNAVTWSVRSAEVFEKASTQRMYFRKIIVRGVFQYPSTTGVLQVKVTVNGIDGAIVNLVSYLQPFGKNQWVMEAPIHLSGVNAHVTISGSIPVEIQEIDWDVQPKPTFATPSI